MLPAVEDPNDFFQIPIRKRVVFLLGGPLANIVVTVALFIVLNVMKYGLTFTGVFVLPILQTLIMLYDFVSVIPSLFERHEELSGVVGVVSQGGEYIGWNARRFVLFSILISLNLAVFNLLPLPPLDGGRLVLCFLEKLSPKFSPISCAFSHRRLGSHHRADNLRDRTGLWKVFHVAHRNFGRRDLLIPTTLCITKS